MKASNSQRHDALYPFTVTCQKKKCMHFTMTVVFMSLLWRDYARLSCWQSGQTFVYIQTGSVDTLAGAVAGDAGVSAAVLLHYIHQDEAVLEARAGDLVSRRVCFNPQNILQCFFLHPVHRGSRGTWGVWRGWGVGN